MKKFTSMLLVLISIFLLSGCIKYSAPLSDFVHIQHDANGNVCRVEMDISEDSQQVFLSLLNNGKWVNDITNCAADYEFTAQQIKMRYHSECGTFIDITNGRSLSLSEEDKTIINQLLASID